MSEDMVRLGGKWSGGVGMEWRFGAGNAMEYIGYKMSRRDIGGFNGRWRLVVGWYFVVGRSCLVTRFGPRAVLGLETQWNILDTECPWA